MLQLGTHLLFHRHNQNYGETNFFLLLSFCLFCPQTSCYGENDLESLRKHRQILRAHVRSMPPGATKRIAASFGTSRSLRAKCVPRPAWFKAMYFRSAFANASRRLHGRRMETNGNKWKQMETNGNRFVAAPVYPPGRSQFRRIQDNHIILLTHQRSCLKSIAPSIIYSIQDCLECVQIWEYDRVWLPCMDRPPQLKLSTLQPFSLPYLTWI